MMNEHKVRIVIVEPQPMVARHSAALVLDVLYPPFES